MFVPRLLVLLLLVLFNIAEVYLFQLVLGFKISECGPGVLLPLPVLAQIQWFGYNFQLSQLSDNTRCRVVCL